MSCAGADTQMQSQLHSQLQACNCNCNCAEHTAVTATATGTATATATATADVEHARADGKANQDAIGSISAHSQFEAQQQSATCDKSDGRPPPVTADEHAAAETQQHDHVALLLKALDTTHAYQSVATTTTNNNRCEVQRRRKLTLKNLKCDSPDSQAQLRNAAYRKISQSAVCHPEKFLLNSGRSYSDRDDFSLLCQRCHSNGHQSDPAALQSEQQEQKRKCASHANLRSPTDYEDFRLAKLANCTLALKSSHHSQKLASSSTCLARIGTPVRSKDSKLLSSPAAQTHMHSALSAKQLAFATVARHASPASARKTTQVVKRSQSPPAYLGYNMCPKSPLSPHSPLTPVRHPLAITPTATSVANTTAAANVTSSSNLSSSSPKVSSKFRAFLQNKRNVADSDVHVARRTESDLLRRADTELSEGNKRRDTAESNSASKSVTITRPAVLPASTGPSLATLQKTGRSPFAAALGIAKLLRIKKNRKSEKEKGADSSKQPGLLTPASAAAMRRVASNSNSNLNEMREEAATTRNNKLLLSPGMLIKSLQQPTRKPLGSTAEPLSSSGNQSPSNAVDEVYFSSPRKSPVEQIAAECVRKWKPSSNCVKMWSSSFQALLNDDCGRELFLQFSKSEFSEENIEFWIACEDYRHLRNDDEDSLQESAQLIYERYIAVQAVKEVNLDSTTRTATILGLNEHLNMNTFELAQRRIESLMEKDSYQRFLRCELYKLACSLAESASASASVSTPTGAGVTNSANALTSS